MFGMRPVASAAPDPGSTSFLGISAWLWPMILGGIGLFAAFQAYYWIGHRLGPKIYASRLGRKIPEDKILKVEAAVRKWGALAVYACFWVPGVRHTLPWVAGVLRISYPWYVVASALGCLTWVPVTYLGLYAVIWGWLELAAQSPLLAVLAALVVLAVVAGFVRRRRRRAAARRDSEKLTTP
ncbi:membrane protein DedA with SNARE-associated domain [Streptosporangium becharense]|uniref:Membrane protein DedA with SNARE-associated domain n=1 Tax=Streptosporangium becharense TaxID=1816182 RepID=A0A7W9MIU0_9ACTN|nr:VTT domain-containing protein [Streptosporangium becharense]MBB2911138.1 membrane protein DedA with SNARE-associated domain [Streptosporangium becharense]MBB5821804.1 membrane protein DedA with SNARE-associated domain [Streptosporangium becharense]